MNKRIARLLRTNITIFSLCLVLFALAAIPFDVRLAIGEGVAAVAFFLLGLYGRVVWLLAATAVLAVGHIGIHLQHRRAL